MDIYGVRGYFTLPLTKATSGFLWNSEEHRCDWFHGHSYRGI